MSGEDGLPASTGGAAYTDHLSQIETTWWRRALPVHAPYGRNVRRLARGRTLEVGCGVGRLLSYLGPDSVGTDHNAGSVAVARSRGVKAFTPDELAAQGLPDGSFGTMLVAHVVEHMSHDEGVALIERYRSMIKAGGRLILIAPQEAGWRTDDTHVRFVGPAELERLAAAVGAQPVSLKSFPLPRPMGRFIPHVEYVLAADWPPSRG